MRYNTDKAILCEQQCHTYDKIPLMISLAGVKIGFCPSYTHLNNIYIPTNNRNRDAQTPRARKWCTHTHTSRSSRIHILWRITKIKNKWRWKKKEYNRIFSPIYWCIYGRVHEIVICLAKCASKPKSAQRSFVFVFFCCRQHTIRQIFVIGFWKFYVSVCVCVGAYNNNISSIILHQRRNNIQ